jgi:glycosyltransferase involved in cell wall biosynthesis
MKILHVLSQRPDSTGSGTYIQAMMREAARCGHTNFLVAGIQADWSAQLDCIGDDHCRFVTFGGADLAHTIVGMSDVMPYTSIRFRDMTPEDLDRYEAAFSRQIETAANTFRPQIIHSHHLWIVTSITRQLLPDIPLVTSCHGSDLRQFQNCPHLRKRVLNGCRGVNWVMALSTAQKREVVRMYDIMPDRVSVVGAGYHEKRFYQTRKPTPDPVQIVYAGKLSRAKGVPWMLKALSMIDAPNWHLHLVGGGSGEEMSDCLRLADRLGGKVTVHGAVTQDHLADIMKQSHLFVLPSFFEGLPLVLLEALASGCRLLATDLPGVAEIFGAVHTDYIEIVAIPRLQEVDKPVESDQQRFENDLKNAIQRQLTAASRTPDIDLSAMADRMALFSWEGVFEKVGAVYHAAVTSGMKD